MFWVDKIMADSKYVEQEELIMKLRSQNEIRNAFFIVSFFPQNKSFCLFHYENKD